MVIASAGLSGVFSGIDTDIIVSRIMAINSIPLNRLHRRRSEWTAKETALADIKLSLTHIQGLMEDMRDEDNLRGTLASSSDNTVFTATSVAGAAEGSYELIINQLAKAERVVHDGVTAPDTLVGTGSFVYSYGDGVEEDAKQRSISTTAETTLENLRDLINNDQGNPGVTASIIEYEVDATHKYHLVLNGRDTGEQNTISIDAGTDLADFINTGSNYETIKSAQDAQIRVDGYPSASWMNFSSNTISGPIPGVTLSLRGTTAGESVSVSRNTADLKTDLSNLVAMYNGLATSVDKYTNYNAKTKISGAMMGDAVLKGILSKIRNVMVYRPDGFDGNTGGDLYSLPSQIGLQIGADSVTVVEDPDGGEDTIILGDSFDQMVLDETKLSDALATDYDAVLELIGAVGTGASNDENGYIDFYAAGATTTAGTYEVSVVWDGANITSASTRKQGEGSWRALTINGNFLIGAVGEKEEGLQLVIDLAGQGANTYTADVRVKQGFGGVLSDLVDDMLDAVDGPIVSKERQTTKALELIDKQIEIQQIRLASKKKTLLAKYARMEMLLAQLDAQRGAVEAMLSSLASNNTKKG